MVTSGNRAGERTTLPVPSQWDMHGFGSLNYHKDLGAALDERGLYEYEFKVPADWADRRVFLVFEGSMTDTTVKVNGQSAGPKHQGSFYRFKFEVTKLLKFGGPNKLEVTVAKHSANESVNRAERLADYWVFGGIYRPVYLDAVPQEFIQRVAIDAQADGQFRMDVFTDGAAEGDELEAQITELDGAPVGEPFNSRTTGPETSLKTEIDAPRQWSAETPNLYLVQVRLKRGDKVIHEYSQRFGFRTFEVRQGDGLYVNGQRVVLKGVNRHSFWPDSGRCLSDEVHRLDIETIKDMNMNAVRMSHYPPDATFLDLCDELGLYVLDELAGWHNYYDTPTGRRLVEEMVTRDVNHPSVLFWDNGNEGGFNKELDGEFAKYDPQRRTVLHPWEEFDGVNTAHYLEYDRAKVAAAGTATRHGTGEKYEEWEHMDDPHKYIYMPTEMLHGLYDGGGGAGFEDYWNMMRQSPLLGGGFFWVFCDEGVKRPDTGQIDCAGNQAPDGLVGPYREREASFYTIKELWSPIVVRYENDDILSIENHYSFTNADQCKFSWELQRFPGPESVTAKTEVLYSGTIAAPSIPPGGTEQVTFNLPAAAAEADALAVRVDDPTGRELWTWVRPLKRTYGPKRLSSSAAGPKATVKNAADVVVVTAGDLTVRFSAKTGFLDSVERGSQKYSLSGGPRPAFGKFKFYGMQTEPSDTGVSLRAEYDGDLSGVDWFVHDDGWITCDYRYDTSGPQEFHGVVFDYPEKLVRGKHGSATALGECGKIAGGGNTFGLWQNEYNDTITGYSGWKYPEFKGCFANVRWLQLETAEGPITVVPGNPYIFVQVLTPKQPPDDLVANTKVSLPQAGLAFLHAIPPMGSKFKQANTTGPHGQLDVTEGPDWGHEGVVNFYFGKLP